MKDAIVAFKQDACHQLHEGLLSRPPHLQGFTDAFPIGSIIGLELKDFVSFHRLVVKASKNRVLAKVFDFVAGDGTKFDAIYDHAAQFQAYLAQDKDLPDNGDRKYLTLLNPVVSKVYQGLLDLRDILTTHGPSHVIDTLKLISAYLHLARFNRINQ